MRLRINAQAVKYNMLKRELNQSELARLLGVSRQSVSYWMRGETLPTRSMRKTISQTLKMSPDDVVEIIEIGVK